MVERKSAAAFLKDVRVRKGKIVPASTWYALSRNVPKFLVGFAMLGFGILLLFAHPIIGGVLIVLGIIVLSRPSGMFTGWHGLCPVCATEIWLAAPQDAPVQGHNCPTCTNRIILRDSHFEALPSLPTADFRAEAAQQPTFRN